MQSDRLIARIQAILRRPRPTRAADQDASQDPAADRPGPGPGRGRRNNLARRRRRRPRIFSDHLQRMVEQEAYCIDILTQVAAATSALQNVALSLLDDHLRHCVSDAARADATDAATKLDEASQAIARLVRA